MHKSNIKLIINIKAGSPYVLSVSATRTAKRTAPICFENLYNSPKAPIQCNDFTIGEAPCQLDYGTGFTTGIYGRYLLLIIILLRWWIF